MADTVPPVANVASATEPVNDSLVGHSPAEASTFVPEAATTGTHQQDHTEAALAPPEDRTEIPLVPPEDCVEITSDGGLLKKTLEEGSGELPVKHARCLVHYVGRLCSTGEVFFDTRKEGRSGEPVQVVAGRDAVVTEAGLNLAAATMKRGEKALLYVKDPKYGYGEKGNFSFPSVPGDAQLVYLIELLEWEDPDLLPDRKGMFYEERLEAAERRRKDGNALFQDGKYKEALSKYAMALSYIDEDFLFQLEGFYLDKAHEVKVPIHLNMAAAQIHLQDYHTAIYNCGQVLNIEKDNVKALFRRGRARHLLGQTEEALEDLEAAKKRSPDDKAVLKEIREVRASIKAERSAEAQLFKGTLKSSQGFASKDSPEEETSAHEAQTSDKENPEKVLSSKSKSKAPGVVTVTHSLWGWLRGLVLGMLGLKGK